MGYFNYSREGRVKGQPLKKKRAIHKTKNGRLIIKL
jgi:hypothetical protein